MKARAHRRRALKDPAGTADRPADGTACRAPSAGRSGFRAGAFTLRHGAFLPLLVFLQAAPNPEHGPPPSDAVAQGAIGELRSPYCPGLMLEVCPSPQAELLRDSIRTLAAAGKSKQELVEWTLGRHGEEWRAVPRGSGVGLWAWIMPPALLVGAGAWLARRGVWLRSRRKADVAPPPVSAGDQVRLEAALREWERAG